jgi:predicted nucleic acid-binding protein
VDYLLDTNVVSETRRRRPNPNVLRWFAGVDGDDLYLSVMVLGEIRQGIERLRSNEPERAGEFEAWLDRVERDYADHIVPISADVADEWGRLNSPVALPVVDTLLAATAKVHEMTLVTRNRKDVEHTGVRLLDPFVGRATG